MFEKNPEELLCATLRGESVKWPPKADLKFRRDFFHAIAYHGVEALFYSQLKRSPAWDSYPVDVRETLRNRAHLQGALDLARKRELVNVLGALAKAGIRPLLMKGMPLAYTLYASAALRCRADTDLLIKKRIWERHAGFWTI